MDVTDAGAARSTAALRHVAALSSGPPLDPGLRITLNFHPDRLSAGLPILEALARDGAYHSQFVTGTGNGGLTAHPGGDRWRWESRIFGGAYDDADPPERLVYGALDFRRQVVEWHPGYRLTVPELRRHAAYRGPEYAELGALIAEKGVVDPRIIGAAARTGRYRIQDLKMVWHTLARFGAPAGAGTAYSAGTAGSAGRACSAGAGGQTPGSSTPKA
ncbi:DUF3626 domain-containing protein [Streptomyces sp. NPDC058464]|uniref:DUF3626 domain-containing protein n=1 Tax=Streptomyces sp. NPDC058464 TaxID=3346511 RepID=UPI003662F8F7